MRIIRYLYAMLFLFIFFHPSFLLQIFFEPMKHFENSAFPVFGTSAAAKFMCFAFDRENSRSVSYTHLDVYKRQARNQGAESADKFFTNAQKLSKIIK